MVAVYEYRCSECGTRLGITSPIGSHVVPEVCPGCQVGSLRRVFSGVAFHHSGMSRRENVDTSRPADESWYRDSRNVGVRTEAKLKQMGVDLGDGFREVVEKARSGELINERIQKSGS